MKKATQIHRTNRTNRTNRKSRLHTSRRETRFGVYRSRNFWELVSTTTYEGTAKLPAESARSWLSKIPWLKIIQLGMGLLFGSLPFNAG